jgi:hypothetical protein
MEEPRSNMEMENTSPSRTYKSWGQIAAYFDGDGSLIVRKVSGGIPFTLGLTADFIDQSRMQILMLESFLKRRRVRTGTPYLNGGAWRLSVGNTRDVKLVLKRMLPHLCKKYAEVAAALDYLEDRITGDVFQTILEREVREGDRERIGSRVDLPWTRSEGLKKAILFSTSRPRRHRTLTKDEEDMLVRQYLEGSLGQRKLARVNGISHAVVRRALARHGLASKPK